MYIVYCTMYNVQCTMYYVLCTMYYVLCNMYYVLCTLYIVHCTLYNVLGRTGVDIQVCETGNVVLVIVHKVFALCLLYLLCAKRPCNTHNKTMY